MKYGVLAATLLFGSLSVGAYIPGSSGYDTLSVRVIYAIPADRIERPEYSEAIAAGVVDVLRWYADRLDITAIAVAGELPQVCSLSKPSSHFATDRWYRDTLWAVWEDCRRLGWPPLDEYHRYVYVLYIDVPPVCTQKAWHGAAVGSPSGWAILNESFLRTLTQPMNDDYSSHCGRSIDETWWSARGVLAHELIHAFGVPHPECLGEIDCADNFAVNGLSENGFPRTYIPDDVVPRLLAVLQRKLPYMGEY